MQVPRRLIYTIRKPVEEQLRNRRLARDAETIISTMRTGERGLFIDCGSNVGQGFTQFEHHFPLDHFDFIMIEPNPHCIPHLQALIRLRNADDRIQLKEAAASTHNQTLQFFGINDGGNGELSQGASTLRSHNSTRYIADESKAINVAAFSLSDLLYEKATRYRTIILKMDIEGAECEVLEQMLDQGTAQLLRKLYVEFHAKYLVEPDASITRAREKAIVRRLQKIPVPLSRWI